MSEGSNHGETEDVSNPQPSSVTDQRAAANKTDAQKRPDAYAGPVTKRVVTVLGVFLCLFTLFQVNYNVLQTQSGLAVFVGVGLALGCGGRLRFLAHACMAAV